MDPVYTDFTIMCSEVRQLRKAVDSLIKDISTPADIAPSALETIILYCFMGYISALTYYLLLCAGQDLVPESPHEAEEAAETSTAAAAASAADGCVYHVRVFVDGRAAAGQLAVRRRGGVHAS